MSKKRSYKGAAFIVALLIFCIISGAGVGLLAAWVRNTPDVDPSKQQQNATTFVYGENDWLIAKLHAGEHRIPVKLNQIPSHLQEAVISIEDERFYDHIGIDPRGIMRSIVVNITQRGKAQGGSTITQQYAKLAYLHQRKELFRKVQDMVLAVRLERKYTKQEILEMYLNEAYFGSGAYGVQAASQIYFGKNVEELELTESALIAGLLQRPEGLNPYNNMEGAVNRRNLVLNRMIELGKISPDQGEKAKQQEITLVGRKSKDTGSAYFIDYVTQQLMDEYGYDMVYRGGLKVYTTLNKKMQAAAEETIKMLPDGEKDQKGITQPQGSIVALDPKTGYIKAMVGGRDHNESKWNRVSQAVRQPGSAFKPFVYAVALQNGVTPATIEVDERININGYSPGNHNNRYDGEITIRKAVEESKNTIAVKMAHQVGINNVIKLTQDLGITTLVTSGEPNDRGLSLALGGMTEGIRPLEMVEAYSALANKGVKSKPMAIIRVEDRNGNVLQTNTPKQQAVLSEEVAYVMTDLLKSVITGPNGTGRAGNIGRPAAGKTGTTTDFNDAWFVGYTPDLVTAVWMGSDVKTGQTYMQRNRIGSGTPTRMWANFMRQALAGTSATDFPKPSGVVGPIAIDIQTGLLAGPGTPEENIIYEVFIQGTQPTAISNPYITAYICPTSGLLSTDFCPEVVKMTFYDREEVPTTYCTMHSAPINTPQPGQDDIPDPPQYGDPNDDTISNEPQQDQ